MEFTMINRIGDDPAAPASSHFPARPIAAGKAPAGQGFRELAAPLEETIKKYPGAALASAFVIGVAVAWWIKRM
jgi:hypothetical protein